MEISTVGWVPEMGMEDAISFYSPELLGDFTPQELAAMFGGEFQHISSSPGCSSYNPICSQAVQLEAQPQIYCEATPSKQVIETTEASSFEDKLCLENSDSKASSPHRKSSGNKRSSSDTPKFARSNKRARTPTTESPCYTTDHVISERKRRAKLSQQFIALSAILPGLKKMDKASILGDTMKHLKLLQEKVKTLEEQTSRKTMESAVYIKKSQVLSENDSCLSDEKFSDELLSLPEIEARFSDKNVLIRIHCEQQNGIFVKALDEMEKLNLSVVNSSVIPFGTCTLDITLVAQMGDEFNMTVRDLLRKLRSSFVQFSKESLPPEEEQ